MKKQIIALTVIIGAATLAVTLPRARGQVAIPIDPVTIQQPVTVTQNVTLTSVPTAAINFDLVNERITFLVLSGGGGNQTIILSGAEYNSVRDAFLTPFSQAIAPTLRTKIAE